MHFYNAKPIYMTTILTTGVNITYGSGYIDLSGGCEIRYFDGNESGMAGEFINQLEGFLDECLVGLHIDIV